MLDTILSWTQLPNLHPAVVHFPIAILPLAVLFDVGALIWARQSWLRHSATSLYVFAALGAYLAKQAGERAADSLTDVAAAAQPHIGRHSDWAHYATWAILGTAAIRLLVAYFEHRREPNRILRTVPLLLGIVGLGLLTYAADLGGGLVYEHGLGVGSTEHRESRVEHSPAPTDAASEAAESADGPPAHRLVVGSDGVSTWRPIAADADALDDVFQAAPGSTLEALTPRDTPEPTARGLPLEVDGRSLAILERELDDVQMDLTLRFHDFEGTVALVHHWNELEDLRLLELVGGAADGWRLRLSHLRGDDLEILDEDSVEIDPEQSVRIAVSASGSHLKGLLGGRTITHGHESAGEPGRVGILLDGRGGVTLEELVITPLDG